MGINRAKKSIIVSQTAQAIKNMLATNGPAWVKPWESYTPYAKSYTTGKYYQGTNMFCLRPGEYITYTALKELQNKGRDLEIRKGCHKSTVYFFKFIKDDDEENADENENTSRIKGHPIYMFYQVFALGDITDKKTGKSLEPKSGSPDLTERQQLTSSISRESADLIMKDIQTFADKNGIEIYTDAGGEEAFQQSKAEWAAKGEDPELVIHLPDIKQFSSLNEYIATAFHELAHAIDAKNGLIKQEWKIMMSDKDRGRKELMAEITAKMLCGIYGVSTQNTDDNAAAYIKAWSKVLDMVDDKEIFDTASKVQKAFSIYTKEIDADKTREQIIEVERKNKGLDKTVPDDVDIN